MVLRSNDTWFSANLLLTISCLRQNATLKEQIEVLKDQQVNQRSIIPVQRSTTMLSNTNKPKYVPNFRPRVHEAMEEDTGGSITRDKAPQLADFGKRKSRPSNPASSVSSSSSSFTTPHNNKAIRPMALASFDITAIHNDKASSNNNRLMTRTHLSNARGDNLISLDDDDAEVAPKSMRPTAPKARLGFTNTSDRLQ